MTIKSAEESQFVSKYIKEDPFATNKVWLGVEIGDAGNFTSLQEIDVEHKPRCL